MSVKKDYMVSARFILAVGVCMLCGMYGPMFFLEHWPIGYRILTTFVFFGFAMWLGYRHMIKGDGQPEAGPQPERKDVVLYRDSEGRAWVPGCRAVLRKQVYGTPPCSTEGGAPLFAPMLPMEGDTLHVYAVCHVKYRNGNTRVHLCITGYPTHEDDEKSEDFGWEATLFERVIPKYIKEKHYE